MDCQPLFKPQQKSSSPITSSSPVASNAQPPCLPPQENHQSISDDRSININIGQIQPTSADANSEKTGAITLSDKTTYTFKIENDTDWPPVIASLVVGAAIAWFAKKTQETQTRANVANFRHDWQINLRNKISEFISKIALIHFKLQDDEKYLHKPDSDQIFSELIFLQSNIELLLDTSKHSSLELTRTMEEIVVKLRAQEPGLESHLNRLNKQANEVLERAWQTIRKDLGVKGTNERRWYSFWKSQ